MGKTEFFEHSLKKAVSSLGLATEGKRSNISVIQSDELRQQCVTKWIKQNPSRSYHDALKETVKDS